MRNLCGLCKKPKLNGSRSFFRIPTNERMRRKWIDICKIQFTKETLICEDHFLSTDIIRRSTHNNLMPSAVPFVPVLHEDPIPLGHAYASSTNGNNISPLDCLDISMEVSLDGLGTTEKYTAGQPQTNPLSLESRTSKKNKEYKAMIENLQAENKNLQAENENLKRKLAETKAAVHFMRSIFTEGQMRKIMTPGKVQWRRNDISSAIRLHAAGPKAYNYLHKKGFPLPHASMLEHWCRKLNINNGFLKSSLGFFKHCTELTSEDKICVLAFNEMKVANKDFVGDSGRKPSDYVQVVMAQGLWKSWRRPVFFDFDCQMKDDILYSIITKLNQAGFPVVAMVCDMGPNNRKLWKELGVTTDRPWFPNPVNPTEKVFTFADAPHLLELIRYHFLGTGLICNNELLTSKTIGDVLKYTSDDDTSITCKVTNEHLSVEVGGQKLAAQLFSNTTANAIRQCNSVGLNINKPIETADLIQLVNDWFDVLNASTNTFSSPGKEPFGIALADQRSTLTRMNKLMSSPIIPNKTSLEYFQEGVIVTNKALEMLYDYVRLKFNMIYILTSRLNQDMLKHVFWSIRRKAGLDEDPTPTEFKHRLRKYVLARNLEHLHGNDNVESNTTAWVNSTNSLGIRRYFDKHEVMDEICRDRQHEVLHEIVADRDPEVLDELDTADFLDMDILEEGALAEYVSRYSVSD